MGEAKRRAEAYGAGRPWRPALICPTCRSTACVTKMAPAMLLSHLDTEYGVCKDCGAFWEAYPAGWVEEVVTAKPCDNCAFGQGSPESSDRAGWRSLLAKLKLGGEFHCHKGCPIIFDEAAGTVSFVEAWIKAHGRRCAGFQAAVVNWPDWLEQRFKVRHVLTTHDQDQLLGFDPAGDKPGDSDA